MNLIEILRGTLNVVIVMIVAGGVAYVGDRVGHQVGRKRLTLYGIRPRYTSTIVAIATGMVIALVVCLIAIFASNEVKTAFFKMNSLNQQIAEMQQRENALEQKVNNGRLILPVDTLMVPFYRIIRPGDTKAKRMQTLHDFYNDAVKFVNANYPRQGLKPFVKSPDADKLLAAQGDQLDKALEKGPAMLAATSDQNLFENDQIHFQINVISDILGYQKGEIIAQIAIPGGSGANMTIALGQLESYVSVNARRRKLPGFLADNVQPLQLYPDIAKMQQIIAKPGTYLLTAYAAQDFYPDLGGIPIVIALTQQP